MYDKLVVEHKKICNLVGVNGEVFEFVVGDRSRAQVQYFVGVARN